MTLTHDLIVVGGGPGGAACARTAAQNGLDVLLIEKAEHPRRKICAGGFRLGLPDLLDYDLGPVIEREACGAHLYAPSGLKVVCTKPQVTGYTVKRDRFDHFLLKKAEEAGAELLIGHEVVAVEEGTDQVTARSDNGQTFASRYLVGADSVNSKVARSTGIIERWTDSEIGLCFEAGVPMDPSDILRITQGPYGPEKICIEIFFGGVEHGYGWCFPKKDEVSLGMGCLMTYAKDLKAGWTRFIERFEKNNSVKVDLSSQSAMRVPLKGPTRRTVSKRVMLVGDAGGFVSPATGEGICYAIETGQIAAKTAADLIKGTVTSTAEYEKRWRPGVGKQLRASNFLANLLFNSQSNMESVVRMASEDEVIKNDMTELIGGLRPYTDLKMAIMRRVIAKHALTGIKMLR